MGSIPTVEFLEDELYHVVPKYTCVRISSKSFKYVPSHTELQDFYTQNNYDLDCLFGKKAHTKEAKNIYDLALKSIEPNSEILYQQLLVIASKLYFIGNEIDSIFNYFLVNIPRYYDFFSEETIYEIVEHAQSISFKPVKKCVVFNPKSDLNHVFKSNIHRKEIGKYNSEKILKLANEGLTRLQIAVAEDVSVFTVDKHLKNAKKSTKGNKKENTYKRVQKWKKRHLENPQKECAKALGISLITVKRNWNKKSVK